MLTKQGLLKIKRNAEDILFDGVHYKDATVVALAVDILVLVDRIADLQEHVEAKKYPSLLDRDSKSEA